MAKIPATKASRIAVGSNRYKLEPAVSRTHYGEHRMTGGGQPYAFSAKRADDAWLVVSEWNGKKHGLVQKWNDGEWTFSKIESQMQTPNWLRAQFRDTPALIYNLSSRLYSGKTPEEAIAHALGHSAVSAASHSTKKVSHARKNATKIQVGDLVRYKSGYGGDTYVVVSIDGDRAKIRSVEGYKGVGSTTDLVDLWKYR